jgi:phosphoribosylglycinamide formyltransferase 1
MHRPGILLSGRRSNFLAIAKAINERLSGAESAIVFSNTAAARDLGLPTLAS